MNWPENLRYLYTPRSANMSFRIPNPTYSFSMYVLQVDNKKQDYNYAYAKTTETPSTPVLRNGGTEYNRNN